jgi:hypothetical protein
LSWNKEKLLLKLLYRAFYSNKLVPQIKQHPKSCQYPWINCLAFYKDSKFVIEIANVTRLKPLPEEKHHVSKGGESIVVPGILDPSFFSPSIMFHYGWCMLWDPTKKGQQALQLYSAVNFVALWLKWLQMILNDYKWLSMCLIN